MKGKALGLSAFAGVALTGALALAPALSCAAAGGPAGAGDEVSRAAVPTPGAPAALAAGRTEGVGPAVDVRLDAAEAEAVLAALAARREKRPIAAADWQRIFDTAGYRRLAARERSLGRSFEETAFRDFVASAQLAAREAELRTTLAAWESADFAAAGRRALAYLPAGSKIHATVYPVIKPRDNSFVFDLDGDPAIFLALDPAVPPAKLENTVAHELHHVGFAAACPTAQVEAAVAALPAPRRDAIGWLSAFGEGFAMLAAAGGPDVHPHAVSPAVDRERWDADVARAPEGAREVAAFLRAVVAGELTAEQAQERGMSFFGVQGPWYTVGWVMATTIERQLGREALIAATCDRRQVLATYQRALAKLPPAARAGLPDWPPELVAALAGGEPAPAAP